MVWMDKLQDQWSDHKVVPSLVQPEQLPEFLHTLDNAFDYDTSNRTSKARWLEGQQKKAFLKFLKHWEEEQGDDDYEEEEEEYDEETEEEL
jgi:hypothetical protein